jgi:hypothetical protein
VTDAEGIEQREPAASGPAPATWVDRTTQAGQAIGVLAVVAFIVVVLAIGARWLADVTGVWPLH